MTTVELGMLVSATAAMGGVVGNSQPMLLHQQQAETPVKRGRGRPKGVKNGAGKAAMEKKRSAEAARLQEQQQAAAAQQQQHLQQQQQHEQQEQEQEQQGQATISAGAGGGWFPGDDSWGQFA